MKKSYIKYFGLASTTLLAVAPVAAPVVQNALNATMTNRVFAAGISDTNVQMDLSGQNEYGRLLQSAIQGASDPFKTISGTVVPGTVKDYNADTVQGLIRLAYLTNNDQELKNFFITDQSNRNTVPYAHTSDLKKYLFTNTDASVRNDVHGFKYYNLNEDPTQSAPVRLNDTVAPGTSAAQIHAAARFISDKLGGRNVADILGSSIFGDPNKASLSIKVNGTDKPGELKEVLRQGRIVITLTATSGKLSDGTQKTAQAILSLQNSNVLLPNANPGESENVTESGASWSGGLSSKYLNTGNFSEMAAINNNVIPNMPWFQVGETGPSNNGYNKYISAENPTPYDYNRKDGDQDTETAIKDLIDRKGTSTDNSNFLAYTRDTIVVPEGTKVSDILAKLQSVRYNGAPSVSTYSTSVSAPDDKPVALAYDNVKVTGNDTSDWIARLSGANFASLRDGSRSSKSLADWTKDGVKTSELVAKPGKITISAPVTGDVFLPTRDNTGSGRSQFNTTDPSKAYVKNFPNKAEVNIVVYSNPDFWGKQYSIGTLPSFALFAPSTKGAVVPTFFDNGQTVKETELPHSLQSTTLNLTVGDARFGGSNPSSKNAFNSFYKAAFANAVVKKQILISDEDVKSSVQPIDTNNLVEDTDFPVNGKYYTIRSNGDGARFTVDSSEVDITKAGTYPVKVTYTNDKNEHGVGVESSTITLPVTIFSGEAPLFYFTGGTSQTIKVGESFRPMNFKVAKNQEELQHLIDSGKASDGKDYVNNPKETGIDVTVSGSVDTSKPGTYTLIYTATNVSSKKSTTLTRTVNVVANDEAKEITEFKAVGYVNYVPGYGINVYNAPKGQFTGQRLPDMSAWKIDHKAVIDGKTWYQVGTNQWVDGSYIVFNPVSHMKPLNGVVRINYVPGYGVRVYNAANTANPTDTLLQHGTVWKVFGELNGFYNVGKDQWIKSEYGIVNP